jgi:hypothetical protein
MSNRLGPFQNFGGGELRNWTYQVLASAPSAPKIGQPYYNSGSGGVFIWNNVAWRPVDAALLTDGSIKIAALESNPFNRANPNYFGTQLAATISDLAATVKAYTLDSFAAPIAAVSFGNQRVTLVANASANTDATNLGQVNTLINNAIQGVNAIKQPVRIATDANITLSGLQTIQSVTLADGDRVLVRAQTTGSQNLIYNVHSGAWTIATDDDSSGELISGTQVLVNEGAYAGSVFRITTLGTITIGTTSITWTQAAQVNSYTADEATLHLTGSQFSARLGYGLTTVAAGIQVLAVSTGGLQVTSGGISILLAPNSLLKTDATGLYVDITSAIAVARITSGLITGNGTATQFTITHGLGTRRIFVNFQDSSYNYTDIDWAATDINTITVTFGTAPANGVTYSVAITG